MSRLCTLDDNYHKKMKESIENDEDVQLWFLFKWIRKCWKKI